METLRERQEESIYWNGSLQQSLSSDLAVIKIVIFFARSDLTQGQQTGERGGGKKAARQRINLMRTVKFHFETMKHVIMSLKL